MTVELSTTSKVATIVEALADCLCQQVAADGLPELCYCGVMPGAVAVADRIGDCGTVCGMAWVRLEQMYPSTIVGLPAVDPGNCGKALSIDIEVGILRCFPTEPTDQELIEATELQLAEAETMYRAIACCPAIPMMDSVVSPYVPLGPEGDTLGGSMMVSTMVY